MRAVKILNRFIHSVRTMNSTNHSDYINSIKQLIPQLTSDLHKGQCGRIGIIGGSIEYTGAPYFAAISALKIGADLVHVFCCKEAAPVIKSYSPELIVHPVLDCDDPLDQIKPWLGRLHGLIVGPGLGRNKDILTTVSNLLTYCKTEKQIPLVIDADGLFLLSNNLNLINEYKGPVVLTPNIMELRNLTQSTDYEDFAKTLQVVLLQKGKRDIIYNGLSEVPILECQLEGSNRRCGGQGDLLSGVTAVFTVWFHQSVQTKPEVFNYSLAAYAACCLTKECSKLAFSKFGRSMTTSDMINEIHHAFNKLFV